MKLFSLLLSVIVFLGALYFFVLKVPHIEDANDVIYIALLVTLMAICIVGVIINWEFFCRRNRNKLAMFVTNGFSSKDKK